jgi:hypothetical protein
VFLFLKSDFTKERKVARNAIAKKHSMATKLCMTMELFKLDNTEEFFILVKVIKFRHFY